jgi:phosphatidylglycerol:prolipoprotein diacylglycerol transferase
MHPVLFDFHGLTIYSYGVLLAASYLLGLQFALVRARRRGLDGQRVMDLGIWIIVSALVGAKLLLFIVDFKQFTSNPRDLLGLARSGGVFYGGLIAAVTVALIYLRRHRLPLWTTTDVFAPGIALGHVVGRMGCLLAGCCFGKPTSMPWAITFTDPAAAANVGTPLGVPLHPTQLYEAGAELLILVFLLVWERRGHGFPGRTFWSYMLLYGVSRFVIEFYRGDSRGMVFDALSTSQFVSVILVPLAIVMLFLLSRRVDPTSHVAAQRAAA